MNVYARLLKEFMAKYWARYLVAFLLVNIIALMSLISPLLTEKIIDVFIPAGDLSSIALYAGLVLAVAVVKTAITFAQRYNIEFTAQKVIYDMRNRLYQHLQTLSFSFFDQNRTGELMSRMTSDVATLQRAMGMGFINLFSASLTIIYTLGLLFSKNWRLTLMSLIFMPFLVWSVTQFAVKVRPTFRMVRDQMGIFSAAMQESITGVRVVKAFAQEDYEIEKFLKENQNYYDKNLISVRLEAFYAPLMSFISNMGTVFLIWYGGRQVIGGSITLGEWTVFNTLLAQLIQPIRQFGMLISMVQRAVASGQRIFEVLDTQSDVADAPGAITLPPLAGHVVMDHVFFSYDNRTFVLEDICLEALPGQTIAILGSTGSGKSSVINLVPRFYDPQKGTVRIDGYDLKEVTIDSLRRQVGIVLQETFLFNDSLRNNIAYGKPDATLEEIISAAKAARIHEFIQTLPDGYDTVVGERGVGLSGGQKQRMAIARALLMQAKVLILDESTSSVDTETEHAIQQAFAKLTENCTTFIIAQRLSTIRNADKIVVLDKGRIVQEGTHEQLLLDTEGIYHQIYEMQLRPQEQPTIVPAASDLASGGEL
ncbi:MAG: ABC transporter ATP-binding protein/permease [Negativicutes bacterium]|nr:ABC transporter ATP-binding protein/permease [Negativicutes bacterium]